MTMLDSLDDITYLTEPAETRLNETITVGQVTGSGVTTIKSPSAAVFDPGLVVQTIKLKWAQVTAWLTTRV